MLQLVGLSTDFPGTFEFLVTTNGRSCDSRSRRLGEIPTLELLQTLAANAAAPFIMCSRLTDALAPTEPGDAYGHIINVSALEGKSPGARSLG